MRTTVPGVKPNPLGVKGKGAKVDGKGEKETDKTVGGRPKRNSKKQRIDE